MWERLPVGRPDRFSPGVRIFSFVSIRIVCGYFEMSYDAFEL
jgi:hypothetical protein